LPKTVDAILHHYPKAQLASEADDLE
ncbi:MAG: hypothetical protein QOJ54_1278, partial [Aliidongia sp.]|nr:hypothetical protein [Aliidongia sp.]